MIFNSTIVPRFVHEVVILLAVIAVAVADVLLKRTAAQNNLREALTTPWLYCAIGLYLFQIGFFILAFHAGWKLSVIGTSQTALYALIVLAASVLLYRESLSRLQMVGIFLTLCGVFLIRWR